MAILRNQTTTSDDDAPVGVSDLHNHKREALVSLLRGQVTCPLISTLGESGAAQKMLDGQFTLVEVFPLADPKVAEAVLTYLEHLGLLIKSVCGSNQTWRTTDLGRMVLRRWGAFTLLHSYEEMFRNLGVLLGGGKADFTVNRARNILGSGSLHREKFFPIAVDRLHKSDARSLMDIGCGDGTWLAHASNLHSLHALGVVDISEIAVRSTVDRLRQGRSHVAVELVCDGLAVERWAPAAIGMPKPLIISFWFVLHEFIARSVELAIDFFRRLHFFLPHAELLLGEIVRLPDQSIATNQRVSILPEYMLFHSLSGQGVLSWSQFNILREAIPYELVFEKHWEKLPLPEGNDAPSHLLWHLKPKICVEPTTDESPTAY